MKKSTKGALAAGAAGVLLLGGAGSLANWTATGDVEGATINSGSILLTDPDCTTFGSVRHDWQYDSDGSAFGADSLIVPGDTITKVCTMTLTLTGTHMGATLGVEGPAMVDDSDPYETLDAELKPKATFVVDGVKSDADPITTPGEHTIVATVAVNFPTTGTNSSQNVTASLDDITVTATQTHDVS
jgi:alternate signal-mediated exported protein